MTEAGENFGEISGAHATIMKIAVFWDTTPCRLVGTDIHLEINRMCREADHSLSLSAETKSGWNYTSTHPYACKAQCLNKRQGAAAAANRVVGNELHV
jgi:hypothetical protein